MTREKAITIISQMVKDEEGFLSDDTVEAHKMAIKALEQEHVLGKIRAEITKLQTYKMFYGEDTVYVERDDVLEIIDRYKESEE